jgi:hypothetical protein
MMVNSEVTYVQPIPFPDVEQVSKELNNVISVTIEPYLKGATDYQIINIPEGIEASMIKIIGIQTIKSESGLNIRIIVFSPGIDPEKQEPVIKKVYTA